MHILVVEDERRLAALMSCRLLEERHTADVIRDGITGLGLALATNAGYDLIVLDRMLQLADEVVRHKIIRLPEKVAGRARRPVAVPDAPAAESGPGENGA